MATRQKNRPPVLRGIPAYEGTLPYLYFAFAEADAKKAAKILRILLRRGIRVWFCCGPAGSSQELLRRQDRVAGAALTMLYLTDAACADKDTKSFVLVNQKTGRQILCLDPDGTDRRLKMGLRETVPHVALYECRTDGEIESALLHAEGVSQEMLGEPVVLKDLSPLRTLSVLFCVLAAAGLALGFAGWRWLGWFRGPDEVEFTEPAILSALREAAQKGPVTVELTENLTTLHLKEMPASWDELALLPALEQIELPQNAVAEGAALPDGDYTLVLTGGGGK
jgi:hypothetical protein